ncbi:MAG: DNA alkylation repair protein [Nitrospirae bacterium GWC2_57_13]|nr:MAG: DNA alkylation repair protein [Nitrospirae bacterium GWC1_57_7]OGW29627.1 MAG: DNA alkylation repair protein [Nitrospirae bacterium GWC2_57_13]HAR45242.1 DNA alkylation repair protein [Nitrospiraceae bacterium]HAS54064.1 DNA alkylation repair protein [Nitrospiraceae bacterium]
MTSQEISAEFRKMANRTDASILQRFFKTGPGEYGEGDRFLGVRVPAIRNTAKQHRGTSLTHCLGLLRSPFHEERLLALFLLIDAFNQGDDAMKKSVYGLYVGNTRFINNWDLVDLSAHHIVGAWLRERSRAPLQKLARSNHLWERRISILATFHYIKRSEFGDALRIAAMLRDDDEDLIHKAVGWMLREIGKRDQRAEEAFLKKHYRRMPRTMLRYAIERFPEPRRKQYLDGKA